MSKLLTMFQDENGQLSTMRLIAVLVTVSFIAEWQHAVWTGLTGYTPDYKTLIAVLGTLGFKTLQKPFEKPVG